VLSIIWDGRPFGHNRHGPKIRMCAPFGRVQLGTHVTQCGGMGQAYLHTKWHLDPSSHLAATNMGQKLGQGLCPIFWRGELGPHLAQCGLGRGLRPYQVASWSIQPFSHNTPMLDRTDRQWSDSIGRTVLQMVAQKPVDQLSNLHTCCDWTN